VPLLLGTAAVNGARHVRRSRRQQDAAAPSELDGGEEQVVLEWRQLDCALADKKGGRKQILRGLEGCARPGRCARGPRAHPGAALSLARDDAGVVPGMPVTLAARGVSQAWQGSLPSPAARRSLAVSISALRACCLL